MFNFFKVKNEFLSPISGKCISITEVDDEVFSKKLMGDGFAIIPSENTVYSPLNGVVSVCFPTKHAIGIKSDSGIELLIHIGIDTVELKGEGFITHVKQGDKINQGDKLVEIDLAMIKSKGYDNVVIIVFPNNKVICEDIQKDIKCLCKMNVSID